MTIKSFLIYLLQCKVSQPGTDIDILVDLLSLWTYLQNKTVTLRIPWPLLLSRSVLQQVELTIC